MTNFPEIEQVQFDAVDERLKVIMPLQRNRLFLGVYSVLLLTWVGVTVWMVTLLLGADTSGLATQFIVVWVILLLIWAYIWYRLGGMVWRWWQYYAAMREVLFINGEVLIVRRPLSLLGVTDAYDMEHVSPFYYSTKHGAVAFDYGSRGGLFGSGISVNAAQELIDYLNARFYPHAEGLDDI